VTRKRLDVVLVERGLAEIVAGLAARTS